MSEKDKGEMSFLEHLEELRWHIIRSLIVVVLLSILAFVFKRFVFDVIILGPSKSDFITNRLLCHMGGILHTTELCLNTKAIKLQSIEMAGQFLAHIKISIIAGFIISFPYVFYEFWKFVRPALHKGERSVARSAVITISILFFLGILFGYYIICPLSVNFLVNYRVSDLAENNIKLMSYVSTVANIALSGGIAFELPVVIYALSKIGLVTPEFLTKYRRHAFIVILIIAAIITPPDVFSQTLVALPLVLLYELSIGISRRINRKKKKDQEKNNLIESDK